MNISDSPPTANVFKEIDADKDNQLSREEVRAMARSQFLFYLDYLLVLVVVKYEVKKSQSTNLSLSAKLHICLSLINDINNTFICEF